MGSRPTPRTTPPAEKTLRSPALTGGQVALRPITPADYGPLQTLELSSDLSLRWRFRGSTPSPEQWAHALWNNVLAQYLVAHNDQPVGLVVAYRAHFQDGYAFVAATRFGPAKRSPSLILGFGLFLDYVFTCWDFRKLYMEVPEFNYEQFASGEGRFFQIEGRLRDHTRLTGEYWDELTLAIYRDAWETHGRQLLSAARSSDRPRIRVRMPHGHVSST
jgi:hypothetical protein